METMIDTLKDLIIESGLSLRKIEEKSGIPSSQLSRYLKGTIPSLNVTIRIAKFFECSIDYLCGLSENKGKILENYDLTKFIVRYLEALKENNLTHWKFAKSVNLSESCLRHWKSGETPKLETIYIIAKSLSVSMDYLLGLTNTK
jgi:transcriptional regulator with XRE-family HTH domain